MRSLALILSITAPVPPAHLSFIDGIFFLRPVSGSVLKMMILASCPPNSITDPHSGYSFSTASETALTSCTNLAPRCLPSPLPPEPVMNMRDRLASKPSISASNRLQNSRTFSGCLVFKSIGMRAANDEQRLLGADLRPDFSHCAQDLFREGRGRLGVGLGSAAQRPVLVHPRGLGDEPGGAAADYDLLAGSDSGRPRRLDALASVRIALGHHRIEQYVIAVISAGCGIVG